jgi:hypothetical protein
MRILDQRERAIGDGGAARRRGGAMYTHGGDSRQSVTPGLVFEFAARV